MTIKSSHRHGDQTRQRRKPPFITNRIKAHKYGNQNILQKQLSSGRMLQSCALISPLDIRLNSCKKLPGNYSRNYLEFNQVLYILNHKSQRIDEKIKLFFKITLTNITKIRQNMSNDVRNEKTLRRHFYKSIAQKNY